MNKNKNRMSSLFLLIGICFLYIPILLIVIYSFNASNLVTIWGGFSFKWYAEIFEDQEIIDAFQTSLSVASLSATISVIIGTLAAIAVSRLKFRGKTIFSALLPVSLVMPEILIGFSLLILFLGFSKGIGWPNVHGVTTIIIAHSTVGVAYATLLVLTRLSETEAVLEEAALDLGATPIKTFAYITLPIIIPAMITAWLLTFTLSLDDLVIASFTSGPGSTTLPMLIFSRLKFGVSPEINVLGSLIIGCILMMAAITYILLFRGNKK
jgi:putrescine transport system permease protein